MRGVVGFNKLNDVIFYKADDKLNKHLLQAAIKNGYITPEDLPNGGAMSRNLLVQIFSPLVTSQRVMLNQFDNIYSSVECQDDLCFIFIMVWSYQFIGISEKEDSLTECRRQLCVCLELVKLICGPALHLLLVTGWEQSWQNEKAVLLGNLMDMWESLRQTELMFVVEGVERLLINRQLSNSCVKLVETVLSRMRAIQPSNVQFCHAFLLVDNKLLSLYSSRNAGDLSKGDLLLLLVLVNVLHKDDQSGKEKSFSEPLIVDSEELLKNQPPSPLPKSPRPSQSSFFARLMRSSVTSDENLIPAKEVTEEELKEEGTDPLAGFVLRQCQVFLHTRSGSSLPHWLCSLHIDDHIKLVLVADISTQVSRLLSSSLELVYGILMAPPPVPMQANTSSTSAPGNPNPTTTSADNPCPHWKSTLDANFHKITDIILKKGQGDSEERILRSLVTKWENLKQAGFLVPVSPSGKPLPPRLEIGLSSLGESLQEGFGSLLVSGTRCPLTTDVQAQIGSMGRLVQEKLQHCHQYLLVKAQRNLAITSYLQDYPGLLFFIYVDRNTGWLLAPSVSDCLQQQRQEYVALLTKDKVWSMVSVGLDLLRSGERLAMLWQDQDFYYSHFIWFEDQAGAPLKPKHYPSLRHFPPPGIIAGDFYRRLTKECLLPSSSLCYELFCLHVGVATPPLILEQARRLAAAVWEISGSTHMPLDLL